MRFEVRGADPGSLGIGSDKVGAGMLDKVRHTGLQQPIRRVLGKREDMLGGVVHPVVSNAVPLYPNSVDEQWCQPERHLDLGFRGSIGVLAPQLLPFVLEARKSAFTMLVVRG